MLIELSTFFILSLTILGFTDIVWWFNILDFFRLQYAVVAIALFIIALIAGHIPAALLNAAIGIVNLYRIRKFLPGIPQKKIFPMNTKILSVNAYKGNDKPERLEKLIKGAAPDLLLIMEMTEDTKNALDKVLTPYKYQLQTPVRDGFSICLLSKTELKNAAVTHHGPGDTPLLYACVEIHEQKYDVFSAHPKPALNKSWHEERGIYFHETEKIIAAAKGPVLVMGDFNSVPWESHFETFLKRTNLKSTVEGHGYKVTWPVYFPVLGIPMDHILITRDHNYSDLHVGPYAGSDHYPISINLE